MWMLSEVNAVFLCICAGPSDRCSKGLVKSSRRRGRGCPLVKLWLCFYQKHPGVLFHQVKIYLVCQVINVIIEVPCWAAHPTVLKYTYIHSVKKMMRKKLLVLLLKTPQRKKRVELRRSPQRRMVQVGPFGILTCCQCFRVKRCHGWCLDITPCVKGSKLEDGGPREKEDEEKEEQVRSRWWRRLVSAGLLSLDKRLWSWL